MMTVLQGEFGLTTDRYWTLLASFSRECEAKGFTHDGMEKYKEHFYNWTRRHVEINGKDGNKNKGKGYGSDNNQGKGQEAAGGAWGNHGESRRDSEIRDNVNNVLAKYGLTTDDTGF